MLMDKKEFEWRMKKHKNIFLYYCRIYLDRRASGRATKEELDVLLGQIDVVLDWYNDLKNKEESYE